jgi:hypothetical protein
MKEATEEIRWAVTVLLVIAAVITIFLSQAFNGFGAIIVFILLAICGALAVRYE